MLIELLGTGGAEGWPALFCACPTCKTARSLGGKNIRTRSAVRIDRNLQVDMPPDFFFHAVRDEFDTATLETLLITHSHYDHCAIGELRWAGRKFAKRAGVPPINIGANADVADIISALPLDPQSARIVPMQPFRSHQLGGYEVFPILASHSIDREPLNFVVTKRGQSVLYACDTGDYREETWDRIAVEPVNVAIIECTYGFKPTVNTQHHLDLAGVSRYRRVAERIGLANAETKWILTHFSHVCEATHDELLEHCEPLGFTVGYDGLRLEI